jgi:transposase
MFWGCISAQGPGSLVPIHGTLNADRYCALLEEHLLPQAATWYGGMSWEFQQDNAPCHKAARTMAFFQENSIDVLEWPPYTPDCNPIENAWALLKKKVYRHGSANTVDDLIAQTLHTWHSDPDIHALCVSLCTDMHKRVEKLVSARGGPIFI